jgi:hypothetical protein
LIITSTCWGIVTIINSYAILPDINFVVDILSVLDFLEADIRFSVMYFSWGLVNMVYLDWWSAW